MSLPLFRHARLSQSLVATRRAASLCRCYSASVTRAKARLEHDSHDDDAPVAGPSSRQHETDESTQNLKGLQASEDGGSESFSRVQSYLASINASGLEPTMEDLEHCRPQHQPPPHSPEFVQAYTELINTLCRSFTKEQLRKFLVQALGTSRHCRTHRRKNEYAESIIEQLWKWPTLKEVEKAKRDRTEIVSKALPVTASELFLILGKDGADLLRLSKVYDVHISLRRKPMALRIEGTRGSIRDLTQHILDLKQNFIEEIYDLPSPVAIPSDMVQRISRLASAYLENVPKSPGKLKIIAKDQQGLMFARRLASRAVHEIEESSRTPLLTYLPPGAASLQAEQLVMYPHNYALYPYLSPRPLPFTMNTSGTFRLRRVGEWLSSDFREKVDSTGGLAGGHGHVVTVDEEQADLKDALLRVLSGTDQGENSYTVAKASMGHMLLTRPSGEQRATLIPPLTGEHPFGKVRKWIAQNPVKMTFVPDLPLPLLDTSPARQSVKHRLVYHALPEKADTKAGSTPPPSLPIRRRKVLALEATLTTPQSKSPELPSPLELLPEHDLDEGLSLADLEEEAQPPSAQTSSPEEGQQPSVPILDGTGVHCWTGVEADLNLMIPDRPMDLQFTVRSSTVLPEARQPAELREYVAQLRAFLQGTEDAEGHPKPPLLIEFEGVRYILHSNSSVRQSEEVVTDYGRPHAHQTEANETETTRAVCESTLDLETNQKSMHCEVLCENVSSEDDWKRFLRDCDRLSVMLEEPKKVTSPLLDIDNDDIL
ncbi:hypothetical protein C8Q77DRAFT_1082595 [Trametes polyzona]|nr:hypothetical protein C8Q77DRAFT_1082595 [Trametes polyzona]